MLKLIALLAVAPAAQSGHSAEAAEMAPPAVVAQNAPQVHGTATASYMVISPSARALDFQQAFEMLRREKATGKVFFQLSDGSIIPNVIEMTPLPNSTLFLFRFNSHQGIRFQVVKVEDLAAISYSP